MKQILLLSILILLTFQAFGNNKPSQSEEASFDEGFELEAPTDFTESEFEETGFSDEMEFDSGESKAESSQPSLLSRLMKPARFTLKHELSYKTEAPEALQTNRSSIRLEYAKFFGEYYYLQFDTKLSAYWGEDHRAEAKKESTVYDSNIREAFLQASFGNTSIKAGIQIVIWGESDGGAITDVISPRNNSELFFISLEESRIGQPMILVDQFTSFGEFSLFYIPDAGFNENPQPGTAYYFDPLASLPPGTSFQEDQEGETYEVGARWKKTFGKSDFAIMAASLLDNEPYGDPQPGFPLKILKKNQRFNMLGVTFNYATGNYLIKGEIGRKIPLAFMKEESLMLKTVRKNKTDTALGLEYSPGGSYTLGFEAVNSHIEDWEKGILLSPEDTNSLVIAWSKTFLNEDLSVNWMSSYSTPNPAFFHSLRSSYKWDDHLTLELEGFYPDIRDEESQFFLFNDQKQIAFKIQYQF